MPAFKLEIVGDPATGNLQMSGPLHNHAIMYFLLGEAKRCFERDANKKEDQHGGIIVPKIIPPRNLK